MIIKNEFILLQGVEVWNEAQFQECVAAAGGSGAAKGTHVYLCFQNMIFHFSKLSTSLKMKIFLHGILNMYLGLKIPPFQHLNWLKVEKIMKINICKI